VNPTKVLEYMATGRPIVSTAIDDVVWQFDQVVKVGNSHDEFVRHCHAQAANPDTKAIQAGRELGESHTWDAVVANLERHVQDVLIADDESPFVAV
jgi:hypothetical protein